MEAEGAKVASSVIPWLRAVDALDARDAKTVAAEVRKQGERMALQVR